MSFKREKPSSSSDAVLNKASEEGQHITSKQEAAQNMVGTSEEKSPEKPRQGELLKKKARRNGKQGPTTSEDHTQKPVKTIDLELLDWNTILVLWAPN